MTKLRTSIPSLLTAAALCATIVACSGDDTAAPMPSGDGGASAADASTRDASSASDGGRQGDDAGATVADAGTGDSAPGRFTSVTLKFKAKVGNADFHCGTTYPGQGATGESVQPSDLRFFVDKVALLDESGVAVPVTLDVRSPWQTADVALLDFEDGSGECKNGNADTNAQITGTIPAGTYRGIVFSNGVPEALNHGDPTKAPAPLQAGGMTWGWLYGYKFFTAQMLSMRFPDAGADAATRGIGLVHLGSVGCDNSVDGGNPDYNQPPTVACSQPNRNLVRLENFVPGASSIVVDVGAIFAATDLSVSNQCHSEGAACPPLFASLGLSFHTGAQLPSQSAYRVE